MKTRWTRWKTAALLVSILLLLTPVVLIEALYYRGLWYLPENPYPESRNYPQRLQDSKWVALGGEGEIKMYRISPVSYVVRLIYFGAVAPSTSQFRKIMYESQGLAGISARILISEKLFSRGQTPDRTLGGISSSIWIANHWDADKALNYVLEKEYFGRHCYGIQASAQNFFGKSPDNLTIQEGLVLVGLPKAPSRYDPIVNPQDSLERTNQLLERLAKNWPDRYGRLKKLNKLPDTLIKTVRRCNPND